jgi:hypothetical protein
MTKGVFSAGSISSEVETAVGGFPDFGAAEVVTVVGGFPDLGVTETFSGLYKVFPIWWKNKTGV